MSGLYQKIRNALKPSFCQIQLCLDASTFFGDISYFNSLRALVQCIGIGRNFHDCQMNHENQYPTESTMIIDDTHIWDILQYIDMHRKFCILEIMQELFKRMSKQCIPGLFPLLFLRDQELRAWELVLFSMFFEYSHTVGFPACTKITLCMKARRSLWTYSRSQTMMRTMTLMMMVCIVSEMPVFLDMYLFPAYFSQVASNICS